MAWHVMSFGTDAEVSPLKTVMIFLGRNYMKSYEIMDVSWMFNFTDMCDHEISKCRLQSFETEKTKEKTTRCPQSSYDYRRRVLCF